uniref:Uncharacterized protein n=1 Tax=Lactuca sativa TaxID=4236 RepID=A0A9R1VHL8_LACSA|nr:hypothetical protein LSAT_V11C500245620 [Lactuca sativa]
MSDGGGSQAMYGQWLGWMMAAIYMGGRIPQIALNGLNPLMFIFALIANAAYVGRECEKIKANMPWLLDAAVCVALDAFLFNSFVLIILTKLAVTTDHDAVCVLQILHETRSKH